jgi:hypothetical protein
MKRHWLVALSIGALLGTAIPVCGQSVTQQWHKGTALSIFGGAASSRDGTDGVAGGAIGWELTRHFALEGSGLWMPGGEPDAWSALFGSRVNLLSPRGVVPFVSGGLGVHRAIVEVGSRHVPLFYMRRMGMTNAAAPGAGTERTFDDFVMMVGGGVNMYIRRHLALRPDVRLLLVRGNAETRPIAGYGVHLSYHFEEHPITP